jgi:Nuclease-related domain
MVIVESKSVHGAVEINEHGEWHRVGSDIGMPSPIEQAKRQATFLKKYLGKSKLKPAQGIIESLFHDATDEEVHVDGLVAISDTGIIKRPKNTSDNSIFKADMITGKIRDIIKNYNNNDTLFSLDSKASPPTIDEDSRKKISEYLVKNHIPATTKFPRVTPPVPPVLQVPPTSPSVIVKATSPVPPAVITNIRCRECGSGDVSIRYGYTYYVKCNQCGKDSPILKENCPKCNQPLVVRKSKNQFYKDCKTCETSKLFFTNTA